MSIKNPIDMFWTSSIEPRIFLLYFLIQIGQGLPWSAVSLMLTRDIVCRILAVLICRVAHTSR